MFRYGFTFLVFVLLMLSFLSKPVDANDVLTAQELLTKLGYTPGPIDGSYGSKTKYALENFYAAQNKKFDGKLDENEIADLKVSIKVFKASEPKLNEVDFGILRDRINTAISLVNTIEITNKYF